MHIRYWVHVLFATTCRTLNLIIYLIAIFHIWKQIDIIWLIYSIENWALSSFFKKIHQYINHSSSNNPFDSWHWSQLLNDYDVYNDSWFFFYHCLKNEYNRKCTISNNQHWAVLLFEIFTVSTSFFTGTIIISQKL